MIMWYSSNINKILVWRKFREEQKLLPLEQSLLNINTWWNQAPIKKNSKLVEDSAAWPNPWDLLSGQSFGELERAIGIFYTVIMMQHPDILDKKLQIYYSKTGERACVVVINDIYVLNFTANSIDFSEILANEYELVRTFTDSDMKI